MADEDDKPEHKVPCERCANFFKQCTGLPNRVCGPCQKAKAKCEKSSRHSGKGSGKSKDKGKALGKWLLDPRGRMLTSQ